MIICLAGFISCTGTNFLVRANAFGMVRGFAAHGRLKFVHGLGHAFYAALNVRTHLEMQVGWSPTYTLTEDFALGMELKKKNFHCRYVQEYIAVGEAPHEVRNCFQQRSRWTKVSSKFL